MDEPPPEVTDLLGRFNDGVTDDLLAIGVHVDRHIVACQDDDGDVVGPRAALLVSGWVKDVAFSDRVLHPQRHTDEQILADIDDATAFAEYEAIRRTYLGGADG